MDTLPVKKTFIAGCLLLAAFATGFAEESPDVPETAPIVIFTGTQGFQAMTAGATTQFLNLSHDALAALELPFAAAGFPSLQYTFGVWVRDTLILDFAEPAGAVAFNKKINNTCFLGIDNTFFLKNVIYGNAHAYASFGLPYNQYKAAGYTGVEDKPFLTLCPVFKLGGKYFFGLDWEIAQDLPVKIIFNTTASALEPTTAASLSFELFRYYGPRDFSISIQAADSFTFSIPLRNLLDDDNATSDGADTFQNNVNATLVFKIKPWSVTLGFQHSLTYDFLTESVTATAIGFSAGVTFAPAPFTFTAGYKGSWQTAASTSLWVSAFNVSWSINLTTKNDAAKK
jgi:hypothetical protein